MTSKEINTILEKQKKFYKSEETLPINNRIKYLKKLYSTIKKYENEINNALYDDLGKSNYESFMCEVGMVLSEISFMMS